MSDFNHLCFQFYHFFLSIHDFQPWLLQQVQEAVANCLPPLVPSIKQGAPELVSRLLVLLLESDNYGERRGAAYGLAGLIKGMGILALKQQQVMDTLTAAIQDKKNPRKREGGTCVL